jgi:hypothetical protein
MEDIFEFIVEFLIVIAILIAVLYGMYLFTVSVDSNNPCSNFGQDQGACSRQF